MKPASASHDTHGHDESLADDPTPDDFTMARRLLLAAAVIGLALVIAGALALGTPR
jgi:hypothetical protein